MSESKETPLAHARGYTAKNFAAAFEKSKADLVGLVPRYCDLLREILTLRQALLVQPRPYAGLDVELAALISPDFLRATPYAQLAHFPRYLKAMKLRADRWRQNPAKDAERAAQLAPYVAAAAKLGTRDAAGAFRWLVEEFRVSLFAQELGTAEPVSAVKLDRALATLKSGVPLLREEPVAAPKAIVTTPVVQKKSAPLKNLGALGNLFPR